MDEFSDFVRLHEKRVYNLCLRLSGNPEDAFDLSQEVFLKAWRGMDDFRGDSALSTWLYRLAYNVCIDFLRKRARQKDVVSIEEDVCLPDRRYEPSAVLEKKELARTLESALEQLSAEHRRILILRETAGLSYKEIAEILLLEEGTVKSRIARARLTLREILINNGNKSSIQASKPNEKKGGGRRV